MKRSVLSLAVQAALFVAVYPVRKDGETVPAGGLLELTSDQAAPLQARKIIKPATAEQQRAWFVEHDQDGSVLEPDTDTAQQTGAESPPPPPAPEPDPDPAPAPKPEPAAAPAPAKPTKPAATETTKEVKKA